MDIKKLNEELEIILEESDNHFGIEVIFTDNSSDDEFSVWNGTLMYGDSEIAELQDENNKKEIENKIIKYCDSDLNKEVDKINFIDELSEKFDPSETKQPTEEDLDDIHDAINTLNKCEWFVNSEKEVDCLVNCQKILKKLLKD